MKKNNNPILLLEDEHALGMHLKDYLEENNFSVHWFKSIREFSLWQKTQSNLPSLAIVDIHLADGNGLELCRKLRQEDETSKLMGILFLSAVNDPQVKLAGLELGMGDYMTKPFALRELMIRLQKLKEQVDSKKMTTGNNMVHPIGKASFTPSSFRTKGCCGTNPSADP